MPFPRAKRVLYRKNPLDKVICQLRFPPVLKIEAEIPADFQERIRGQFPEFSEKVEPRIQIQPGLELQLSSEILSQGSQFKNYEFSSENGDWQVNLTRTFIALSSRNYERWEEFREKLDAPLKALVDIYRPEHFSRVGLRYIDVIQRSILGLEAVSWTDLLQPFILGFLGVPEVRDSIKSSESKHEIRLSDGEGAARVITALIERSSEMCFLIDTDFSIVKKMKLEHCMDKLDYFNRRASRLIQWCLKERLHESMEPQEL